MGDHDGTCNMSMGQLVWEKWSKMSKNQFSIVLVWDTVAVADTSARQACSYLCRDGNVGWCCDNYVHIYFRSLFATAIPTCF